MNYREGWRIANDWTRLTDNCLGVEHDRGVGQISARTQEFVREVEQDFSGYIVTLYVF